MWLPSYEINSKVVIKKESRRQAYDDKKQGKLILLLAAVWMLIKLMIRETKPSDISDLPPSALLGRHQHIPKPHPGAAQEEDRCLEGGGGGTMSASLLTLWECICLYLALLFLQLWKRPLNSFTWGSNSSLTWSGYSTLFWLRTMTSGLEVLILIPKVKCKPSQWELKFTVWWNQQSNIIWKKDKIPRPRKLSND